MSGLSVSSADEEEVSWSVLLTPLAYRLCVLLFVVLEPARPVRREARPS